MYMSTLHCGCARDQIFYFSYCSKILPHTLMSMGVTSCSYALLGLLNHIETSVSIMRIASIIVMIKTVY